MSIRIDFTLTEARRETLEQTINRSPHLEVRQQETLLSPLKDCSETEPERLTRALERLPDSVEAHGIRREIGDRLAEIEACPGVGVNDGVADILWLSAAPGGDIQLKGVKGDEAEAPPESGRGVFGGQETKPRKRGVFTVQPFYIAKFLVTDAQYQAFVKAEDGFKHPDWWAGMPANYQPHELADQHTKAPNNPRDTLSWYQCVAFARWLDAKYRALGLFANFPVGTADGVSKTIALNPHDWQIRLPLEWEWQWAAQNGDEARKYPWGDWKPGFANTNEAGLGRAIAVGMYPHGSAECGALDMAGNLFEWCLNDTRNPRHVSMSNDEEKALRGGSFDGPRRYAACACRHSHSPGPRHHRFGFRLVVSAPIAALVSAAGRLG